MPLSQAPPKELLDAYTAQANSPSFALACSNLRNAIYAMAAPQPGRSPPVPASPSSHSTARSQLSAPSAHRSYSPADAYAEAPLLPPEGPFLLPPPDVYPFAHFAHAAPALPLHHPQHTLRTPPFRRSMQNRARRAHSSGTAPAAGNAQTGNSRYYYAGQHSTQPKSVLVPRVEASPLIGNPPPIPRLSFAPAASAAAKEESATQTPTHPPKP